MEKKMQDLYRAIVAFKDEEVGDYGTLVVAGLAFFDANGQDAHRDYLEAMIFEEKGS